MTTMSKQLTAGVSVAIGTLMSLWKRGALRQAADRAGVPNIARRLSLMSQLCFSGLDDNWGSTTVIQGLLRFDECPSRDEIREVFVSKVLSDDRFVRFRSICHGKIDSMDARFLEIPLESFNVNAHITDVAVENELQLMQHVESQMMKLIDKTRPLWSLGLIHNHSGQDGLLFRCHHAIGDGLALLQVFEAVATDASGKPLKPHRFKIVSSQTSRNPFNLLLTVADVVYRLPIIAQAILKVLSIPLFSDTACAFNAIKDKNGSFTLSRSLRWQTPRVGYTSPPISLAFIKNVKVKAGDLTTVNDVLSSAFGGAIRRYLDAMDPDSKDTSFFIRAMVPVALHRPDTSSLSNSFCLVSAPFYVGTSKDTSLDRLKSTRDTFQRIKSTNEVRHLPSSPSSIFAIFHLDHLPSSPSSIFTILHLHHLHHLPSSIFISISIPTSISIPISIFILIPIATPSSSPSPFPSPFPSPSPSPSPSPPPRPAPSPSPFLSSAQAAFQLGLQKLLGKVLSASLQKKMGADLICQHSFFFSNVPGHQQLSFLSNHCIRQMSVPMGNVATQVTILSYNGHIKLSMSCDPQIIARPDVVVHAFIEELKCLGHELGIYDDPADMTIMNQ